MLRYWSSLRYSFPLFLLGDDLRCQPTWLYLDAEVSVLPPVLLPQDRFCWLLSGILGIPLPLSTV